MSDSVQRIRVIDSHTAGEPTRVVVAGGPNLGSGTMAERRARFARDFDSIRSAIVNEPRGHSAIVGALLCEPVDPVNTAGVIFFNNGGMLDMCGHGTIGLAITLRHLGRIDAGTHTLETPVGLVRFELDESNKVGFENVPSYRYRKDVTVDVEGIGPITGDVAWGGNWFYLVGEHGQELTLARVDDLLVYTRRIERALRDAGITGPDGEPVEHIELFGPAQSPDADSRNFVLCSGSEYDRSPCGTGTSAKLACLYEDGKLEVGRVWRQEGIAGMIFEGSVRMDGEQIIPCISGSAFVTGEQELIFDRNDPLVHGLNQ